MIVGILAVQGAFAEHEICLRKLGVQTRLIRQLPDLEGIDRLVLPGGESTTQRKLLRELGLFEPLKKRLDDGMPALGTCAGLILLAQSLEGDETPCFQKLPVLVKRNAYGRQLGSFSAVGRVGDLEEFPMRFIRAPYVSEINDERVRVLSVTDGRVTGVRLDSIVGLAFHPELTDDLRIHEAFLKL